MLLEKAQVIIKKPEYVSKKNKAKQAAAQLSLGGLSDYCQFRIPNLMQNEVEVAVVLCTLQCDIFSALYVSTGHAVAAAEKSTKKYKHALL